MAKLWTSNQVANGQAYENSGVASVTDWILIDKDLEAGDVLQMIKVPDRAVIQEGILSTSYSLGTTCTVEVGDAGDRDRYILSQSFGAGKPEVARMSNAVGHGYMYDQEMDLPVTIVGITAPVRTAEIALTVIYTT